MVIRVAVNDEGILCSSMLLQILGVESQYSELKRKKETNNSYNRN
jgi:hypothetical protein